MFRESIAYLNRRGAFKIKNAATIAAKYYDISRYTLYNYLNIKVDAQGTQDIAILPFQVDGAGPEKPSVRGLGEVVVFSALSRAGAFSVACGHRTRGNLQTIVRKFSLCSP